MKITRMNGCASNRGDDVADKTHVDREVALLDRRISRVDLK